MGRVKTIARRTFLIGSVAIVGGVAFGVWRYKTPYANPLLSDLPEGAAALTPYVLITSDAITLITPRADKGQGAISVQAALVAEELDVDLDQIKTDPGPPSPAYYNTALSGDAVPLRATDESWLADTTRSLADAPMKFLGMQITGGSTTVPDGFDKLRHAGAVARETLKATAARLHNLSATDLRTERGAVILPDGTRLSYQSLAAEAATTDPVTDVTLRAPSDWRLLGKPMQRIDIVAKSTGTQDYGIDVTRPDMAHAALRLNPAIGGARLSHDPAPALAMRGVIKVVALPDGVAVIADNTWRAMQAVAAIPVEWGPAQIPLEMDTHWQTLSDSFTPDRQDSQFRDEGDVETALYDGTDLTVEYRAPYLAHAPLEPLNATVLYTPDRVDIWTGTQVPRFVQNNVAKLTDLTPDAIHIHALMIGGSFGHRLEDEVTRHAHRHGTAGQARETDLFTRRGHDPRLSPPDRHGARAGPGRQWSGRGL